MLLAYTNCEMTKPEVIARVRAHREADTLVFGRGWDDGKGCAVGCTLHTYDHSKYPAVIGVPEIIARLEDSIFEGLGRTDQKDLGLAWPEDFLTAIPIGADLSMVWPKWALWMLNGLDDRGNERLRAAIEGVSSLYREWGETGKKPDTARWRIAASAADADAYASDAASDAAAYAAITAAAAAYAADAYAASAITAAAAAAYAADADVKNARAKFWRDAREQLLNLLSGAPIGSN